MCCLDVSQRLAKESRDSTGIAMKNDFRSIPAILTAQLIESNNCLGNSDGEIPVAKYRMDVKQIRLIRLRQHIGDKYDGFSGRLADALGMKRPQLTRWVTKNSEARQGISEESARDIEKKEGLPKGWLDRLDDSQEGVTMAPLVARIFALPCPSCGQVSHQSFIDLEMNDAIPCPACSNSITVADYYGQAELAEFLKSIGASGFVLRSR